VVLTELAMPGLPTTELCQKLRKGLPYLPILVVTAREFSGDHEHIVQQALCDLIFIKTLPTGRYPRGD
jgi:CheY-like chemotaxis protein